MKLSSVMLGSSQPKVVADFYAKFLGEPVWQQEDWFAYNVESGNYLVVGPHSEIDGSSKEPARVMIQFDSNDVAADFKRISDFGGQEIKEPYKPGGEESTDGWVATLADPDGNFIQLATPWVD